MKLKKTRIDLKQLFASEYSAAKAENIISRLLCEHDSEEPLTRTEILSILKDHEEEDQYFIIRSINDWNTVINNAVLRFNNYANAITNSHLKNGIISLSGLKKK